MLFRSVVSFAEKNRFSVTARLRVCWRACAARAWSRLPLRLLHLAWAGLRLFNPWSPPCMSGIMWSAVSAPGLPHSAQSGSPIRIAARLRLYSAESYGLGIGCSPVWTVATPPLRCAPQGACASDSTAALVKRPPAVPSLSLKAAGCFSCRTVACRICVVWTLHDRLDGVSLYPRSRVFYGQSATPYAGVVFFVCEVAEGRKAIG